MSFSSNRTTVRILRIIALVPAYAIISFLSVAFPDAATYLEPWADAYESVALASLFLLLVVYLVPIPESEIFFGTLPIKDKRGHETGGGSLAWFRRRWICVFQYVIFAPLVAIATDITQSAGIYCASSSKPHFAHIWVRFNLYSTSKTPSNLPSSAQLEVVRSVSVAVAFLNILAIYTRLRSDLRAHKPFLKLIAIKGIVFLSFLQNIIFTILHSTNALKPTSTLSYNDITFGLPNLLLCIEMLLFSFLHLVAFDSTPYHVSGRGSYEGGPLGVKAIAAACNPMDIISAIVQAVGYLTSASHGGPVTGYQDVGLEPLRHDVHAYGNSTNLTPPYPSRSPGYYAGDAETGLNRDHSQSPERLDETGGFERGRGGDAYTPLSVGRY
ncbi:hypothetical protein G7Y79_00019g046240 [Physcia stellaris]|nr:hypothetical protein G7Y79_00019g046240 [Physcia stellaris]